MNEEKFWKIGTSINSYIEWLTDDYSGMDIKANDIIETGKEDCVFYLDGAILKSTNDEAAFSQSIRTFLFLGILELEKEIAVKNWAQDLKNKRYKFTPKSNSIEDIYSKIISNLSEKDHFYLNREQKDKKFIKDKNRLLFSLAVSWSFLVDNLDIKIILNNEDIHEDYIKDYYKEFIKNLNKFSSDQEKESLSENFNSLTNKSNIKEIKTIIEEYNQNYVKWIKEDMNDFKYRRLTGEEINEINFSNANSTKANVYSLCFFFHHLNRGDIKLTVPIYQRKYRWNENLVKTMLNDILESDKKHFIGTIICNEKDNWNSILDGQQRLSTILLITKALIFFSYWKYKNQFLNDLEENKIINCAFETFVSHEDETNIHEKFKRIQGNKDFEDFENLWLNNEIKQDKISIVNYNFGTIIKWLNKHLINYNKCLSFWNSLLNDIIFVLISVNDNDQFKLFERMNTKNEPLNAIELIKNKIYEYFKDEIEKNPFLVENNQRNFQEAFENLVVQKFTKYSSKKNSFIDESKINNFINSFGDLEKNNADKNINSKAFDNFWKFINTEILKDNNSRPNYLDFLNILSDEIDLFEEITNPERHTSDTAKFNDISDCLYTLISNKKTIYIPLVRKIIEICSSKEKMSVRSIEKISNQEFNKMRELLHVVQVFELRNSIVGIEGQSIRPSIQTIINRINEEKENSREINGKWLFKIFKETFEKTNSKIESIDIFKKKLAENKIKDGDSEPLLIKLQSYIKNKGIYIKNGSRNLFLPQSNKYKKMTKEHIIPRKFQEHWLAQLNEDEDVIKNHLEHIGNHLIITKSDNSSIKNEGFEVKKQDYIHTDEIRNLFNVKGLDENEVKLFSNLSNEDMDNLKYLSINDIEVFNIETIKKRSEIIASLLAEILKDIE